MLLSKHHGLGNDFLVALEERNGSPLLINDSIARAACARRRGVGADGLIYGALPDPEQVAAGIDVVMHLFNSDGSRAEMSGNGVRCLAQAFAREHGLGVTHTQPLRVLTDSGLRVLSVAPGEDPSSSDVSVEMGIPRPGPHIPGALNDFLTGRHVTVDMGNPHLVIEVQDPEIVDLGTEGPWLESQFPHGVNIEYIAVNAPGSRIVLRVWERGAGITEACGTGACAAAFAAHQWGLLERDDATVTMPGGDAKVSLGANGSVTLTGPSVFIADVTLDSAVAAVSMALES